jgi:hypothetical protein
MTFHYGLNSASKVLSDMMKGSKIRLNVLHAMLLILLLILLGIFLVRMRIILELLYFVIDHR